MDRFAAMISFRRVVEARSFAAAARQLGVSAAAITKHVQWLEQELGTTLLHRTTRSVRPTDIGAAYFERCVLLLDELDEAEAVARRDHREPRGRLRVNAPVSFGLAFLGRLLAIFHQRHPQVMVELTLDDRLINPSVEGADVVLRISRALPDSALVARRLAGMTRVVCAAPSYLERRGVPRTPAELVGHDCAAYVHADEPDLWRFEGPSGAVEVAVTPCLVANNSLLLRDAVVAGIGVAILPSYLIGDDLGRGRVATVLDEFRPHSYDVYALSSPARQRSGRVQALVDLLADELPRLVAPGTPPPATPRARSRRRS